MDPSADSCFTSQPQTVGDLVKEEENKGMVINLSR